MQGAAKNDVSINDLYVALKAIINLTAFPAFVDTQSRMRVYIDSANSTAIVPVSGTLTAVTNLSQMGGYGLKSGFIDATDTNLWSNSIRTRIT